VVSSIVALSLTTIISKNWKYIDDIGNYSVFISGIPFLLMLVCGFYSLPPEEEQLIGKQNLAGNPFSGIIKAYKIPSFRSISISYALQGLGSSILNVNSPLSFKYLIQPKAFYLYGFYFSEVTQEVSLQIIPTLIAILSIPVYANYLLPKLGKNRLWLIGAILMGGYMIATYIKSAYLWAVFCTVLLGPALGIFVYLPDLMLTTTITELENNPDFPGKGSVIGAHLFVIGLINILIGVIQSAVLSFTGYIQPTKDITNPIQPDSAKYGIWLLVGLIPFIFYVISYCTLPSQKEKSE